MIRRGLHTVRHRVDWFVKKGLYKLFGIQLPKLADQRDYWRVRGEDYMDEILASGYLERESFFQDKLLDFLKDVKFSSFFEAGCGFGWNISRIKHRFPKAYGTGVDFSFSQLENSKQYLRETPMPVINGDNCQLPLKDNALDVGFSVGVFMNIHPDRIHSALSEMLRVCSKYIIHIEYDETRTTSELRDKRAHKTNIVSHDYSKLYAELGAPVMRLETYRDFGDAYNAHAAKVMGNLTSFEGFEGPEKYVFIVIDASDSARKERQDT